MNHHYNDITERIAGAPLWWDEHAVPRYCGFAPQEIADIYASECCLLHIECQACGVAFKVAMSWSMFDAYRRAKLLHDEEFKPEEAITLAQMIKSQEIHYGDPPNYGCCGVGATMNSIPRRVLEYWAREKHEWIRQREYEIVIEPDWVTND